MKRTVTRASCNRSVAIKMLATDCIKPFVRNPRENDSAEDRILEALRTCEFKISVRTLLAADGHMVPRLTAERSSASDKSVKGV
jgi:hypothetical protein